MIVVHGSSNIGSAQSSQDMGIQWFAVFREDCMTDNPEVFLFLVL